MDELIDVKVRLLACQARTDLRFPHISLLDQSGLEATPQTCFAHAHLWVLHRRTSKACPTHPSTVVLLQLLGENAAKISNFASFLRSVFRTDTDPVTLEVAAATLGHLVQTGGALTADVVEYEVCRCFTSFCCYPSCFDIRELFLLRTSSLFCGFIKRNLFSFLRLYILLK